VDSVSEKWNAIPLKVCQNLKESMPRRIQAVVRAKEDILNTRVENNRCFQNCPNVWPLYFV